MKKGDFALLIVVIISGFCYYYLSSPHNPNLQEFTIKKVIDGDTLELENNVILRLKGINTPEENEPFSKQATAFLRQFENKTIQLENHGTDKYGRILAYIFYNNKLINELIVEEGLGHIYFYEEDPYYETLKESEERARNKNLGIWEKSNKSSCLKLIELKYTEEERCTNQEQIIVQNFCPKVNITIKDDATHIYKQELKTGINTLNFSCIFNNDGDSLYVYDKEGLILFHRY
jgi:micrococcal nuclease